MTGTKFFSGIGYVLALLAALGLLCLAAAFVVWCAGILKDTVHSVGL